MNPGSDIGKKELPPNIRAKFSEIFVEDLTNKVDLEQIVQKKLFKILNNEQSEKIVDLYLEMKSKSEQNMIEDSQNKRPHISLRNLARTLNYVKANHQTYVSKYLGTDSKGLYTTVSIWVSAALYPRIQKYFLKISCLK
jgi:midasin